ncbi:hypothetical protein BRD18_01660 [Halobacteriales archaeon SW_7_71_33]|nr:MAG: hypothetical protein BRD18_01660 [Halobacteriales archaeon SW_7_71_33]
MPEAGLYRVLDERHEDAWLFVPVGEGTGTATAGDESDETGVDDADVTADGVEADETPTPGVPGGDGDVVRADEPSPGTDRSYDPVRVPRTGHGEVDGSLAALSPGYLVRATLSPATWSGCSRRPSPRGRARPRPERRWPPASPVAPTASRTACCTSSPTPTATDWPSSVPGGARWSRCSHG